MSELVLKVVTPNGTDRTVDCDSVNLWMAPDVRGHGEGSLGIRKGHAEAVIALGNGPLEGRVNGQPVFRALTEGGFATVLHDTVTVVTPRLDL